MRRSPAGSDTIPPCANGGKEGAGPAELPEEESRDEEGEDGQEAHGGEHGVAEVGVREAGGPAGWVGLEHY